MERKLKIGSKVLERFFSARLLTHLISDKLRKICAFSALWIILMKEAFGGALITKLRVRFSRSGSIGGGWLSELSSWVDSLAGELGGGSVEPFVSPAG